MNDLPFIFYKPSMMFMDTIGMSRDGKVAHRQLADYVWINDGPPLNDNDILRDVTNCAATDWARVKRELIGKGWMETPKFFLHKGIVKTLNYSKKKAVESYNKTCAANGLPRRELLEPDPETGVTHYVTSDATPTDGNGEGKGDKKEGGNARAGEDGEHRTPNELAAVIDRPLHEIPDFEQAYAQTVNAGIPKDFCKFVFDDWSSRSGKDGGGNAVQWLPYVTKRWARESVEWRAKTHKGNRSASRTGERIGPALSEVQALVREKFSDDPRHGAWAASFHGHWSDLKRNWSRNGRPIDWKVEMSAQCAKWRAA